jgi:hypothetical protein
MYDTIPHNRRLAVWPSVGQLTALDGWWARLYLAALADLMACMGVA